MLDVSSQHIECLDPTQGMPGPGRAAPKVGEEYLGARSSQPVLLRSKRRSLAAFLVLTPPRRPLHFLQPAPGHGQPHLPLLEPGFQSLPRAVLLSFVFFPALHLAGSSACSASAKPAGLCREMRRFCRPGAAAAVLRVLQPRALALSGSAVPAPTELSHVSIPTPRCAVRVRARSGARRPQRETSGT